MTVSDMVDEVAIVLDQIRKAFFHFSESADTQPKKESRNTEA